jgi:hypothetical protein
LKVVSTGAITEPLITQSVWVTETGWPDEPTSPVIVEPVQVTAPAPRGAALRTAKFPAAPMDIASTASAGEAKANSAAVASRLPEKDF